MLPLWAVRAMSLAAVIWELVSVMPKLAVSVASCEVAVTELKPMVSLPACARRVAEAPLTEEAKIVSAAA